MNDCLQKRIMKWILPLLILALCLGAASCGTNKAKNPTDEEAIEAIQNYLDLQGTCFGSPWELLEKLNLLSPEDFGESMGDGYMKTGASYADYREVMLSYMTERRFEENFTQLFRDADGALCYFNGGATGLTFEVKSVTPMEDGSSYIALADNILPDDSREEVSFRFSLEYEKGKWVVSNCE